jgi:hypothetical protein
MSTRTNPQINDLTDAEWNAAVEVADDELRGVAGSLRMAAAVSTCHQCGGYDCD